MRTFVRTAGLGALALATVGLAGCGVLPGKPYSGPIVAAVDSCYDLTASIYFNGNSAALTGDAKAVLRGAAAQAEGCKFGTVNVYGLTDPVGTPADNAALSRRRAEVVTQELARLGFKQVTFKLIAQGAAGAVMPGGEVEPLRRRADIIFSR
jgi:peptidoglycan-associated lipoprotein